CEPRLRQPIVIAEPVRHKFFFFTSGFVKPTLKPRAKSNFLFMSRKNLRRTSLNAMWRSLFKPSICGGAPQPVRRDRLRGGQREERSERTRNKTENRGEKRTSRPLQTIKTMRWYGGTSSCPFLWRFFRGRRRAPPL